MKKLTLTFITTVAVVGSAFAGASRRSVIFFTTQSVWRFAMYLRCYFHDILCNGTLGKGICLTEVGRVTPHSAFGCPHGIISSNEKLHIQTNTLLRETEVFCACDNLPLGNSVHCGSQRLQ